MDEKVLIKITKGILDFLFYMGIPVTVISPLLIKWGGRYYPNLKEFYFPMVILFLLSGILAIRIIYRLKKIFKTVIEKDCFVHENVKNLKAMGFYSLGISGISLLRLFFVVTPATLVIILTFFIAGLFSFVLASVFEEAIRYKLENDLTI